jgi:ABC-2 type transport system ATP-binding protein
MPRAVHALRTSDDRAAVDLARRHPGMTATAVTAGGLELQADDASMDAYVISLGKQGIAVRSLERRSPSLESLFLQLTATVDSTPTSDSMDGSSSGAAS